MAVGCLVDCITPCVNLTQNPTLLRNKQNVNNQPITQTDRDTLATTGRQNSMPQEPQQPPFRLYGANDYRIVGDLPHLKNNTVHQLPRLRRSRNTTPTNSEFTDVESSMVASRTTSAKLTIDGIIPFYASQADHNNELGSYYDSLKLKQLTQEDKESFIQPQRVRRQQISVAIQVPHVSSDVPPQVPPKDIPHRTKSQREFLPYPPSIPDTTTTDIPPYNSNLLPPLPQPLEKMYAKVTQFEDSGDIDSFMSRKIHLEHDLIKLVMNQPLITFNADKLGDRYYGKRITITMNLILYLFEICLSIIEIVLASVLIQRDEMITVDVYRYFIADGVITIIIALLFTLQIVTYEKRNGSFYCTAAFVFKLVSFIMIVAYIFPNNSAQTHPIWQIRRALGAFIIISTFLWVSNLIMFLTTLYISKLNLLEDLNFDYDQRGLNEEFNTRVTKKKTANIEDLKEFYLNENGEMHALLDDEEREKYKNNNKILVYTF